MTDVVVKYSNAIIKTDSTLPEGIVKIEVKNPETFLIYTTLVREEWIIDSDD